MRGRSCRWRGPSVLWRILVSDSDGMTTALFFKCDIYVVVIMTTVLLVCSVERTNPVKTIPLSPPVISMTFGPNNSPLSGKEGTKLTSTMIKDRLNKEIENNVTITLRPSADPETIDVQGRGELQIGSVLDTYHIREPITQAHDLLCIRHPGRDAAKGRVRDDDMSAHCAGSRR